MEPLTVLMIAAVSLVGGGAILAVYAGVVLQNTRLVSAGVCVALLGMTAFAFGVLLVALDALRFGGT